MLALSLRFVVSRIHPVVVFDKSSHDRFSEGATGRISLKSTAEYLKFT